MAFQYTLKFSTLVQTFFMGTKEKIMDEYISKSADFAQPILHHLRELVHTACPEVEEKMK